MAEDERKVPTRKSSNAEVEAFLRRVAVTPVTKPAGQRGRLIFAMDATASREPTWDRACHIQSQMFTETSALGGLDIQMVYYRGFRECRSSPWLSASADLLRYMSKVRCVGGHTQLGKVLRHAIGETKAKKVDALVFVGDCMEEDPDQVCHIAGELGLLGVPCFIFHEGREPMAMRTFKHISSLTKGAYCSFDATSAKTLRDLLSAVAVYAAGGRRALADFSMRAGGDVLLLAQQVK